MIRANLLPRPKETVGVFGMELDADDLRQALLGLALVTCVALIGIAFESLRMHRIESAALSEEAALAHRAVERDEANGLALDVARYQEIGREEDSVRRSGGAAAVTIASIGNSVPGRVWLDSMTRDANGYELAGGSQSVDALSGAIIGLGSALPGRSAALVNIENRKTEGNVHFTARIAMPAVTAEHAQ